MFWRVEALRRGEVSGRDEAGGVQVSGGSGDGIDDPEKWSFFFQMTVWAYIHYVHKK